MSRSRPSMPDDELSRILADYSAMPVLEQTLLRERVQELERLQELVRQQEQAEPEEPQPDNKQDNGQSVPPSSNVPQDSPAPVISSLATAPEIIAKLSERGCNNLTSHLNLLTCSQYPVSTGGFADVYSCRLHDNTKVAIKVIRPCDTDSLPAGKYEKRTAKELYAWSKCNYPHVARLLGLAEFQGRLAMISDWAENGTLPTFLKKHDTADRCSLSTSICKGLAYLHKKGIVHGDLKGTNILVSENGTPMLTDFGNASLAESTIRFTATTTTAFSLRWTAPEILEGGPVSWAGDIYALGMTILETITGDVPFSSVKDHHIFVTVVNKRRTPSRPESQIPSSSVCGNILWALLMSCWSRDPSLRPKAKDVKDFMKPMTPEKLAHVRSARE